MKKRTTKIVLTVLLAIILLCVFAEISEAARWKYHARRNGWIVVFGTRNCRIVTRPLRIQRVYKRGYYSGWMPWWCNDWMVWHVSWRWPWFRPRITRTKYIPRPCPRSCWRKRWVMAPVHDWLEDYMPYKYDKLEVTVPSFGYHEEFSPTQVPHPEIYVMVDMSDLIEAEEGPVADGNLPDPNTPVHFVNGKNSSYPGITIAVGEDPFRFNPDADANDPNSYPFEVKDPCDLFTGDLYLQSDQTFDSNEYPGALKGSDTNCDGKVDLRDFARYAELYLKDVNTVSGPNSFIPDPNSFFDMNEPEP